LQAINGLLDRAAFWRQQAAAWPEPQTKGRREAGLFLKP
jgi:hypothetical protein